MFDYISIGDVTKITIIFETGFSFGTFIEPKEQINSHLFHIKTRYLQLNDVKNGRTYKCILTDSKAALAFTAILCTIWHGQPVTYTAEFFCIMSDLMEFLHPMLTDVLSSPMPTQFWKAFGKGIFNCSKNIFSCR